MLRRRTVLAVMLIGIVPAFAIVNALVSSARARRDTIASDWARRGDVDLSEGRADAAAEDFRTAGEYARDRGAYRSRLALALVAAGRHVEAQAQLQTLWNETPGDGGINLQLARIAARQSRIDDAIRYYHTAIDGAWNTDDPVASRRNARLELARLLLAHGDRTRAQVELLALAADPPPAVQAQTRIAQLLVDAGADTRALALLRSALTLDAVDAPAAALAGSIAMRLGDFRGAQAYFERARRAGGLDADGAAALDTVTRVLELDPDARGLAARERLRRTVRSFEIAAGALDRCPSDAVGAWRAHRERLARQVNARSLAADPDLVDETLAFAAGTIDAVRTACGEGDADERALDLVFHRRSGS